MGEEPGAVVVQYAVQLAPWHTLRGSGSWKRGGRPDMAVLMSTDDHHACWAALRDTLSLITGSHWPLRRTDQAGGRPRAR
jgi:hypothetical protein